MSNNVRTLSLQKAEPGMVLAAPICDSGGNDLLAAGTELTAALLASLIRRGVVRLQVVEEVHLSEAELHERREKITERLDYLFRHGGEDPLMCALHQAVLKYRLEGLK